MQKCKATPSKCRGMYKIPVGTLEKLIAAKKKALQRKMRKAKLVALKKLAVARLTEAKARKKAAIKAINDNAKLKAEAEFEKKRADKEAAELAAIRKLAAAKKAAALKAANAKRLKAALRCAKKMPLGKLERALAKRKATYKAMSLDVTGHRAAKKGTCAVKKIVKCAKKNIKKKVSVKKAKAALAKINAAMKQTKKKKHIKKIKPAKTKKKKGKCTAKMTLAECYTLVQTSGKEVQKNKAKSADRVKAVTKL